MKGQRKTEQLYNKSRKFIKANFILISSIFIKGTIIFNFQNEFNQKQKENTVAKY
jgi:hypothetical protein